MSAAETKLARIRALCDEPSAAATNSVDLDELRMILDGHEPVANQVEREGRP